MSFLSQTSAFVGTLFKLELHFATQSRNLRLMLDSGLSHFLCLSAVVISWTFQEHILTLTVTFPKYIFFIHPFTVLAITLIFFIIFLIFKSQNVNGSSTLCMSSSLKVGERSIFLHPPRIFSVQIHFKEYASVFKNPETFSSLPFYLNFVYFPSHLVLAPSVLSEGCIFTCTTHTSTLLSELSWFLFAVLT